MVASGQACVASCTLYNIESLLGANVRCVSRFPPLFYSLQGGPAARGPDQHPAAAKASRAAKVTLRSGPSCV